MFLAKGTCVIWLFNNIFNKNFELEEMNENRLCVLLGAGFSKLAGLPLVKEINEYFTRDNVRKLLNFSSGEWKWTDFASDVDKSNGTIPFDHIAYGFILNELVVEFTRLNGRFSNYEDFYQFVSDNLWKEGFYSSICSSAQDKFILSGLIDAKNPNYNSYGFAFTHPNIGIIFPLINYLISDLLFVRRIPLDINRIFFIY